MEQGSPNGVVVNMTRAMEALSPLLNHPRKMIIQVEALVTAATALLFLQLILGSCKRRWHNSIVKVVLSLSNAVMFPLILYTLGVMQSSPIKNSVYPVLAVSLLMAAGGTNAVRQYDFNDKKKLLEYVIEMARYAFYLLMLATLVSPTTFKQYWGLERPDHKSRGSPSSTCFFFLFVVSFLSKVYELQMGNMFRYSHNGKIVANWMKKQTNDDHQNDSDPESLKGYNYPVRYKPLGLHGNGVITVDQIWSCCSNSDNGKALKDVCLSFALFELLKRRHFGFVCAEASLPETKDFVFKCLLPTENHYKRAFRIIEMELGFCYDFFFTKYHSIYIAWMAPQVGLFLFAFLLVKISLIYVVGVYTLKSSLILETRDPIIEVHSTRADYIIALVALGTVLTVELLQAVFYLASDCVKVSLACMYVTLPHRGEPIAFLFEKVIGFLRRITISVGWRNMIGQFSVISDFTYYYNKKGSFWNRMMLLLKKKPAAEVSGTMKMYIARSLISTHGNLTNGETSLISTNVKLGKQLELLQDGNQCWKVLADFWAEAIIYIAPSHMTVKQHMEHLENGGEFLTQIWAMLSHCGILNLESDKDQGAKPDQFTPEIV
ncbi:hypothetical protein QOZ80_6AG0549330 [Eleusine coracana subsp. coracana]|nr:hypothetical protein QOZ80_6AG0549330 [Eleusine coracana subsp. coracana]